MIERSSEEAAVSLKSAYFREFEGGSTSTSVVRCRHDQSMLACATYEGSHVSSVTSARNSASVARTAAASAEAGATSVRAFSSGATAAAARPAAARAKPERLQRAEVVGLERQRRFGLVDRRHELALAVVRRRQLVARREQLRLQLDGPLELASRFGEAIGPGQRAAVAKMRIGGLLVDLQGPLKRLVGPLLVRRVARASPVSRCGSGRFGSASAARRIEPGRVELALSRSSDMPHQHKPSKYFGSRSSTARYSAIASSYRFCS